MRSCVDAAPGMRSQPGHGMRLRLARPDEQRELESLQRRASLANPGDRQAILAHQDAIELPIDQISDGRVFVLESGKALRGFAAIQVRADGDIELDGLFVEPSLWRRGFGAALVAHCVEAARSRGAKALHVLGNPHATAFYCNSGFEIVGIEATRFGSGLRMRRSLADRPAST
jgi:GNAT superfamily N-acetyltransferase